MQLHISFSNSAVTYKLLSLGLGNCVSLECIISVSSLETLPLGSVNDHQVAATQPFVRIHSWAPSNLPTRIGQYFSSYDVRTSLKIQWSPLNKTQ